MGPSGEGAAGLLVYFVDGSNDGKPVTWAPSVRTYWRRAGWGMQPTPTYTCSTWLPHMVPDPLVFMPHYCRLWRRDASSLAAAGCAAVKSV
jgi:hypothetical protein